MNVFSEKSGDALWKLVRKGTAQAFAAQNLRRAAAEAPMSVVPSLEMKGTRAC